MNNLQSTTPSQQSDFSTYVVDCRRHNKYYDLTKIALLTIVAAGIVLAVISHFGYLDRAFMYVGAAISPTALIALAVLKLYQPNQLLTAMRNASNFQELKEVLDIAKIKYAGCCICIDCCGADGPKEIYSDELRGSFSSILLENAITQLEKSDSTLSLERVEVLVYKELSKLEMREGFLIPRPHVY